MIRFFSTEINFILTFWIYIFKHTYKYFCVCCAPVYIFNKYFVWRVKNNFFRDVSVCNVIQNLSEMHIEYNISKY